MLFLLPLLPPALTAPEPPSFKELEAKWRKQRHDRLASENGWLTLVGLHWLKAGENSFGSDPSCAVPLPPGKAVARAGSFVLEKGVVRVKVGANSGLTLKGQPLADQILKSDADGEADILGTGDLAFFVIKRGDRFGIRVKDAKSAVRLGFKGIAYYAPDPAYRVVADFIPYASPKTVQIPTVLDTTDDMQAPGYVKFKLRGKEFTLEPVIEDPAEPRLFFIFRDQTSGKTTYPAGRFLYSAMPKDGKVVLDFNQAYNPPCAFTPYATCPLPPPRNRLTAPIKAGEKTFGHH